MLEPRSDCWFWIGHRVPDGYGTISIYLPKLRRCVTFRAHRVSYEWFVGEIPEGMELNHTCHCPPCINPDHLKPVTREENARGNSRKHTHKWRSRQGILL